MECVTNQMTIGHLWVSSKQIDLDPAYQRETGVWSTEKKQLFVDSLINKFDVPKLYLHDRRHEKQPIHYAVVDGKQRLSAVWEFIEGKYGLAEDFKLYGAEADIPGGQGPAPGQFYPFFPEPLKEYFKSKSLDVVLVRDAE